MANYLIGDLQGCDAPLGRLLETLNFSPSRDTVFMLGDLVNRGPDSLAVLRRLRGLGAAARCLLGNHDLHLLAVADGKRKPGRKDTLDPLLAASDGAVLLDWLRTRELAIFLSHGEQRILMVHAGVLPQWDADTTMALAAELQEVVAASKSGGFPESLFGNAPVQWHEALRGDERLRVIVNALTRLRFCTPAGAMEFAHNGPPEEVPSGYLPWFEVPNRRTRDVTVAFGHWSSLGFRSGKGIIALDTGCVWGGYLTAVRLAKREADNEHISVRCEASEKRISAIV